jgi:phosphatidyl-myo-inositol dimannoside synthase
LNHYKKVLLISSEFPPGPGGIGNHAFHLANNLDRNNINVKVLTISDYADQQSEEKFDAGLNFKIIRFRRFKSRIKTYKTRVNIISETLKNEEFTHVIFSGKFPLLTSLLLKKHKRKFIAIAHGAEVNSGNPVERFFVNKSLSRMDLIIPVSKYTKSKLNPDLGDEKIVVIPNGFDFTNIGQIKIKEKFFQNGNLDLVTVGTVWPRKGQHNVINALPEILLSHPKAIYHIIGRLVDLSLVKNSFGNEKFREHLKIHGSVPNDEMQNILNESQIFILLSESQTSGDFEGFGIAVLEANYFGLPAIGSKNSGLEDAIKNGVSGLTVDPKNGREVSEAVNTIAKNYPEYSKGARQWAEQHHWSNIIKRYIEAFDKN